MFSNRCPLGDFLLLVLTTLIPGAMNPMVHEGLNDRLREVTEGKPRTSGKTLQSA